MNGLLEHLKNGLAALGCRVILPGGPVTPVVSFTVPGKSPADVGDILTDSYDIICRTGLHCAPDVMKEIGMPQGTVRLSLSRFTTMEELDEVLAAVRDIVEDAAGGS